MAAPMSPDVHVALHVTMSLRFKNAAGLLLFGAAEVGKPTVSLKVQKGAARAPCAPHTLRSSSCLGGAPNDPPPHIFRVRVKWMHHIIIHTH